MILTARTYHYRVTGLKISNKMRTAVCSLLLSYICKDNMNYINRTALRWLLCCTDLFTYLICCRHQFLLRKFQTFGSVHAVFCAKWRAIQTISTFKLRYNPFSQLDIVFHIVTQKRKSSSLRSSLLDKYWPRFEIPSWFTDTLCKKFAIKYSDVDLNTLFCWKFSRGVCQWNKKSSKADRPAR